MSDDSTPPHGFGKGVNDYLNSSVALADAKAAAFLAAAATVGVGVLQVSGASTSWWVLRTISLVALTVSASLQAVVILPRLPSGRSGLIFWEDIRKRPHLDDYVQEVTRLRPHDIEVEYASQNYFISDVLHRKHQWIRFGVSLFIVGVASGVAAYLVE